MEKKSFEEFVTQVELELYLNDNGYSRLADFYKEVYTKAAELYADQEKKAYAREAVKADREITLNISEKEIQKGYENSPCLLGGDFAYFNEGVSWQIERSRNLPIELP